MARAAATKPSMAAALGIDVRRTNMLTFGFGAALAGAGGALLAPVTGVVPTMGQTYVGQAFMTVVVGGPQVLFGTGKRCRTSWQGLRGGFRSRIAGAGHRWRCSSWRSSFCASCRPASRAAGAGHDLPRQDSFASNVPQRSSWTLASASRGYRRPRPDPRGGTDASRGV